MRSLLFVPGDSRRKLEKALDSGADALILDLEDSVAPGAKAAARDIVRDFIAAHRSKISAHLFVRINGLETVDSGPDLAGIMRARPDGIVLPKASGMRDVERLSARLRVHEAEQGIADGATRIVAIITETPTATLAAGTYRAARRLAGLTWGAEDLSSEIGAAATRDEDGRLTDVFRLARALTLLAASAAETAAIDTVFTDFRDGAGLAAECAAAARDGFTGKLAIHPSQVAIINAAFTPSAETLARAQRIVDAFREAGDAGVLALDGKMVDRPHLKLAERLLARAKYR